MWIVQWEAVRKGEPRPVPHSAAVATEALAETEAERLTRQGVHRVTFFELPDPVEGIA